MSLKKMKNTSLFLSLLAVSSSSLAGGYMTALDYYREGLSNVEKLSNRVGDVVSNRFKETLQNGNEAMILVTVGPPGVFDPDDKNSVQKMVDQYRGSVTSYGDNLGGVATALDELNDVSYIYDYLSSAKDLGSSASSLKELSDWLTQLSMNGNAAQAKDIIEAMKHGKKIGWKGYKGTKGLTKGIKESIEDVTRNGDHETADILFSSSAVGVGLKYRDLMNSNEGKYLYSQDIIISYLKKDGVTDSQLANQKIKVAKFVGKNKWDIKNVKYAELVTHELPIIGEYDVDKQALEERNKLRASLAESEAWLKKQAERERLQEEREKKRAEEEKKREVQKELTNDMLSEWGAEKWKNFKPDNDNLTLDIEIVPYSEQLKRTSNQGANTKSEVINYLAEEKELYARYRKKIKDLEKAVINPKLTEVLIRDINQITVEHEQLVKNMHNFGITPKYSGFFSGESLAKSVREKADNKPLNIITKNRQQPPPEPRSNKVNTNSGVDNSSELSDVVSSENNKVFMNNKLTESEASDHRQLKFIERHKALEGELISKVNRLFELLEQPDGKNSQEFISLKDQQIPQIKQKLNKLVETYNELQYQSSQYLMGANEIINEAATTYKLQRKSNQTDLDNDILVTKDTSPSENKNSPQNIDVNFNDIDSVSYDEPTPKKEYSPEELAYLNNIQKFHDTPLEALDDYKPDIDSKITKPRADYFKLNTGINEDTELVTYLKTPLLNKIPDYDYEIIDDAQNGTLTLKNDGEYAYQPFTNFNGKDSFTFVAKDKYRGLSEKFTVNIDVFPVADKPLIEEGKYVTFKDRPLIADLPTIKDLDGDGGKFIYSLGVPDGEQQHGSLELTDDNKFIYKPVSGYVGQDSFKLYVFHTRNSKKNDIVTVNVNVKAPDDNEAGGGPDIIGGGPGQDINDDIIVLPDTGDEDVGENYNNPPIASNASFTLDRNELISQVLPTATDKDGDSLSYSIASQPANGSLDIDGKNYKYIPSLNFVGNDSFKYTVSDDKGGSNTYEVILNVVKPNNYIFPQYNIVADKNSNFIEINSIADSEIIFEFINKETGNSVHTVSGFTDAAGKLTFEITDKNMIDSVLSKADSVRASAVDSEGSRTPVLNFDLSNGIISNNNNILSPKKDITIVYDSNVVGGHADGLSVDGSEVTIGDENVGAVPIPILDSNENTGSDSSIKASDEMNERAWGGVITEYEQGEDGHGRSGLSSAPELLTNERLTKKGIESVKSKYLNAYIDLVPELNEDNYDYIYNGTSFRQFNKLVDENEYLPNGDSIDYQNFYSWVYGQPYTDVPNLGSMTFEGYLLGSYYNDDHSVYPFVPHHSKTYRNLMFNKATGDVKLIFSLSNTKLSGYFDFNKEGQAVGRTNFDDLDYTLNNRGIYQAEQNCFGLPDDSECNNIKLAGFFGGDESITETGGVFHADDPSESDNDGWIEGIFKAKSTEITLQDNPTITSKSSAVEMGPADLEGVASPNYGVNTVGGSVTSLNGSWAWQYSGKGSIIANTDSDETIYGLSDLISDTKNLSQQSARLLHTAPNSEGERQIFRTQSSAVINDNTYINWGEWNQSEVDAGELNNLNNSVGHWIYGQKRTNLPSTGSGSYQSNVVGDYLPNSGQIERGAITGDMGLNVAFNTGDIDGSMSLQRGGTDWASANFNQPNAIDGSEFKINSGSFNVINGGSAQMQGFFAGPNVEEVGGSFLINKQSEDMGAATGVFIGQKKSGTEHDQIMLDGVDSSNPPDTNPRVLEGQDYGVKSSTGTYYADIEQNIPIWSYEYKAIDSLVSQTVDDNIVYGSSYAFSDSHSEATDDKIKVLHKVLDSRMEPELFLTKSDSIESDGYDYMKWGRWDSTEIEAGELNGLIDPVGYWVYGQARTDLPKTGLASYSGDVMGDYVNANGQVDRGSINGDINLNVDFGSNFVGGNMVLLNNGTNWANIEFNQPKAINDGRFKVTNDNFHVLNGGGGHLEGFFAGPNIEEVGGSFTIDKQDKGIANGVFIGKKE